MGDAVGTVAQTTTANGWIIIELCIAMQAEGSGRGAI